MNSAKDDATQLAHFAAMIGAIPEPILFVGVGRHVLLANTAACELLGAAVVGAQVMTVLRQPGPVVALERAFAALGMSQEPLGPFEARMQSLQGGQETIFALTAKVLPSRDGIVVSFRDISHIEEAEQQRRDFVANVSHELRSPLTVLMGFIETLQGPAKDDSAARAHFLKIMEREAQRMTRLVGDLLSLSKVESNEKVRPRDRVSLTDVVHTTLAALRPQIEEAGVDLRFEGASGETDIIGDRDQLVQVCMNLVENALKYGASRKKIEIQITRREDKPGMTGPVMLLSITDHGEGIDALHLPRLTERFYRVDSHRSREQGGTGLGLAIVKHIINRHRGRLSITSVRGEGSTFTVVLPCG